MEFKLPDIGEGVHEGEVVRWLVKQGDAISVDQPLLEIMTDKATVEIPSPHAGKVEKLHAKEGDMVKVGQVVVSLGTTESASQKPAAPAQKQAQQAPQPQRESASHATPAAASMRPAAPIPIRPTIAYTAEPGRVLATPATRRLARDLGIDLAQVPATGPKGRVTKEDVQNFGGAVAAGPQIAVAPARGSEARAPMPAYAPRSMPAERETLVPFRGMRKKISEAMTRSRQTIPEFTYVDECDISELVAFRKEAKSIAEKQGVKLTYLPFICKAAIRALREFPYMNAVLDEQGGNIVLKNYFNIGVAVDTPDGLVVPVIKDADQKNILQLAHEMQVLADKARLRKLALEDLQGGTFTLTNAGNIGGMLATPIINWPEVAIMGIHKISRRPIVKTVNGKDEIAIADMIWLSVAVDHRVVDGAMAARFMNVAMEYLSSPKKMMLDMA